MVPVWTHLGPKIRSLEQTFPSTLNSPEKLLCSLLYYRNHVISLWDLQAVQFVKQLADALHNVNSHGNDQPLQLVYVIGPPYSEKLQPHDFGTEDLQSLGASVDGFSLMTYDYSNSYSPGPNAPLKWVHSTVELLLGTGNKNLANKVLVGLNFYGNDFVLAEGMLLIFPLIAS